MFSATARGDEPIRLDVVDYAIPKSLTGAPGNADAGKNVFLTRTLGNCLACHQVSALKSEEFHGEFGPSLDGVATRYNAAQLRLIVADPKRIFTDTVMPAFYKNDGLNRVRPEFVGKPVLTAAQVEDVVAYLETLK
ncbi:putative monoheme cytochrome c sulfur oxidizing protein(SoxX) [Bradyrhizobium sp. STM 3809]|nr:putative monoheme cytochrome c sulfur oxidizing protein(SoxX) [Bradyrhizobium sp. STM 3809]